MKKLIIFVFFLISFYACLMHDEFCANPSQLTIFGYELAATHPTESRFYMFTAKNIEHMCKVLPPFVTPHDPIKTLVLMTGYMLLDGVDVFVETKTKDRRVNGAELIMTGILWTTFDLIDIGRSLVLFSWTKPISMLCMLILMLFYTLTVIATALCLYYLCCFYVARFCQKDNFMAIVPMWNIAVATIEMLLLIILFGSVCAGIFWMMNYVIQ